ncbi:cytochrome oxidase small assembly protein [Burkholderia thailandensis]|nr:cytochrome oxidase small assembly protein [Burkholderia thailandensis]MCS3391850.1 cytochrome oxidase small assembly protein [Burkholderia thailandensis]MCS6424203.1 cytochrome oxidase small assembly protein [Burkholderia thailandensis]MCS6452920.1 cytochrome oxidase small assembly protein [Burkholderia thailandensis]MCS6464144.1 cytochrome oxidase small assembly protein [Burkholderia thailandensis]MCS6481911.1 cytochrome oxidase small assembly protein [Burkholderia thailandensis]
MSHDAGGANRNEKIRMTRNSQKRRTPDEIRSGNKRLLLILLIVVAVFFVGAVVRQWIASTS